MRHDADAATLLASLKERAKELECLYKVESILGAPDTAMDGVLQEIVGAIVAGWQFPELCRVRASCEGACAQSDGFGPTPWMLAADVLAAGQPAGRLEVAYGGEPPAGSVSPFLPEEAQLLRTIAHRLGQYVLCRRARWGEAAAPARAPESWRTPVRLLRNADQHVCARIARKMLNHLIWIGVEEAQACLGGQGLPAAQESAGNEANSPGSKRAIDFAWLTTDAPFELAAQHLDDEEILNLIQRWMQADRITELSVVLGNPRAELPEIAEALRRYDTSGSKAEWLPQSMVMDTRVSLIRRLLTEQLDFIKAAKDHVDITDFEALLERVITPADGSGKLGGKAAGLYLAQRIIRNAARQVPELAHIRVPRTWYITSTGLAAFVTYNDFAEVRDQKYKDIDQVRHEYPNIVQLFKSSPFPPAIAKGLVVALDDLGDSPLIVRSSSLLEDRLRTAFSGKYKSLFVGNQGTKQQKLQALLDAVAEVYASTYAPDPIAYRKEHGLIDFNEEMGILIQEVVGTRMGRYHLPAFAGVAFSSNELRWSPRIAREDGLLRLVPGLGTRAVDRVGDDYPILAVPRKPGLRVNSTVDEIVRYSPRKLDVLDLETNTFETVTVEELLRECGTDYPMFEEIFSHLSQGMLRRPSRILTEPGRDELVVTFDGLLSTTPFAKRVLKMLDVLREKLLTPVDLELAHDGKDLYLLQCRPQSSADRAGPAPIPKDVPAGDILFTANRHVSNGWVPDITHVVYVDPGAYAALPNRADFAAVGRAVGRLNALLPKRQFILMGPGRWGSRGDVTLGVPVSYSDIQNTAMLIEIARKKGSYVPDLSFGTHFFQDLVESKIHYLPLYPDDPGICFGERFLLRSNNLLGELAPTHAHLGHVVHVVEIPAVAGGRVLRVRLNADLDEAIGYLAEPSGKPPPRAVEPAQRPADRDEHWRWRLLMAEKIAAAVDRARFGVEAMYVLGSTKNATARPGSDIDLLVHFRGSGEQREALLAWLSGWSQALAVSNYLRTGYKSDGLLDVHLVTDEDIESRTSFAVKIGAVTDPARPLSLRK